MEALSNRPLASPACGSCDRRDRRCGRIAPLHPLEVGPVMPVPEKPKHEWHVLELDDRFGHGLSCRVQISRQGERALFVRRDESSPESRIMALGGNPPLVCELCGAEV